MNMSDRYNSLEPYFFAKLSEEKSAAIKKGKDLVDLSVGDPDLEPPVALINNLKKILDNGSVHSYPPYIATEKFRIAACNWLKKRHGVVVDSNTELTGLIGSKEGMAHFLLATVNAGDYVVIPTPYYPAYSNMVRIAGGIPYFLNVEEKNNYQADLNSIPKDILEKTKVFIINYPNNPTSATMDSQFLNQLIEFAHKYNFIVCSDAAYIDIYDGDNKPISFLSADGAKDVGVEFHSLSKTFSIPGWRLAYMAGNKEIITATRRVKHSLDSGQFMALDLAAAHLLEIGEPEVDGIRSIYTERRKYLTHKLQELGFGIYSKPVSLYIWAKMPHKGSSFDYFKMLLDKIGVVVMPGIAFGDSGEGYIRFSLTSPRNKLEEAMLRMAKL